MGKELVPVGQIAPDDTAMVLLKAYLSLFLQSKPVITLVSQKAFIEIIELLEVQFSDFAEIFDWNKEKLTTAFSYAEIWSWISVILSDMYFGPTNRKPYTLSAELMHLINNKRVNYLDSKLGFRPGAETLISSIQRAFNTPITTPEIAANSIAIFNYEVGKFKLRSGLNNIATK